MAKDLIGYEALADQALRSVVKEALKRAAKQGLLGSHHFYLTFKTHDRGVHIPEFLLERYPDDMTIVIQNQFWGLKVGEEEFEVGLTFQKVPATLVIPFAALTAFVDPGVQFGLQFRNSSAAKKPAKPLESTKPASEPTAPTPGAKETVQKLATPQKSKPRPSEKPAAAEPPPETPPPTDPQVVSIDKFRKK